MTSIKIKKILLFLSFLALPLFSYAQSSVPKDIPELEEQIYMTVNPPFPSANQEIEIRLEAYGTDLSQATITWQVDGVTVKSGRSETKVTVTAGRIGQKKTVRALITPSYGGQIVKTLTVFPQGIDVIWEARTYAPPFYKGKTLFSPQEEIVVVGIPDFRNSSGDFIQPGKVSYKWRVDGTVLNDSMGYGANSFKTKGSLLLRPLSILVEASGDDGAKAKKNLVLENTSPSILIYEKSPLYGLLFNRSIVGSIFSEQDEKTFAAYPLHFGTANKNVGINYTWKINGDEIFVPSQSNSVTFRNTEGIDGTSIIGVTARHTTNFFEDVSKSFEFDFLSTQNDEVFSF